MNQKEIIEKLQLIGYRPQKIGYKDDEAQEKEDYLFREWKFPENNADLLGTPFYYLQEDDFLHFTSIESIYSIINSGKIRLYNLINMDDKYELKYATEKLNLSNSNINDKKEIYILSMCSAKSIFGNMEKEHLLWKLYGKDGFGAIIRLKLINNINSWHRFYLSEIFYNFDLFEYISKLFNKTRKDFLDALPASFIKLPIYQFENEIRIVFDNRHGATVKDYRGNLIYPIIHKDKVLNRKDVKYFELPLINRHNRQDFELFNTPSFDGINHELPKIEITQIILGYRYPKSKIKELKSMIDNNLFNIEVTQTKIAKYY